MCCFIDILQMYLTVKSIMFKVISSFSDPLSRLEQNKLQGTRISLIVYDLPEKEVVTLLNENLQTATYDIRFVARLGRSSTDLSGGIYFYQLKTSNFSETKKLILLK